MSDAALEDGESVVLIDRRGRRYLKTLRAGHRMTIRSSVVAADDLIGRPEGTVVASGEPERFTAYRPTYAELVPLLTRPAEPMFAKDAGLVLVRGDIRPHHTVIEVGAGPGAMSMALLRVVGAAGRLITYEAREDFAATARANVESYERSGRNWQIKVRDARDGFDERGVDRIFADMPEPASLLAPVADALRAGGLFTSYVPTVLQVKELHDSVAESAAFAYPETFELLERSWHVESRSIRPDHRMIGHTGFLTVVRRTGAQTSTP